jgi:hypothetical protein
MNATTKRPRFPGLNLSAADRTELDALKKQRALPVRLWKRIRALELLDEGWNPTSVALALGTYRREVRRVGWRYLDGGVAHSLTDEPRGKPAPMLSSSERAALAAMVCGPPPEGRARWTIRLIAEEAVSRSVVDHIGRETVRLFLASHDLKPWREKNVVRAGDHP